jgi:putative hydrolase of the HAD superfamily
MDVSPVLNTLSPLAPLSTDTSPGGHLQGPVHCVLCDIYGTLLISASGDIGTVKRHPRQWDAIAALLRRYGHDRDPEIVLKQLHIAIESEHAHATARGVDFPEVTIETIWEKLLFNGNRTEARAFALEFEILINPVWPMPGLFDLLNACRQRPIVLGIVSNAQFYTPVILEYLIGCNLYSAGFHPDLTILSFRHGIAKPSRRVFEIAVKRLGVMGISPHQAVYMGNDMRNDIAPAQAVGFQTVLFAGDKRSLRMRKHSPQCDGIKPDLTITHLDQLTNRLCNKNKSQCSFNSL